VSGVPAEWQDNDGKVVLGGVLVTADSDSEFATLTADGTAFTNVTKPTIESASSAAIIAALVTLGLVIDDT
jgi:hypothetical protein